MTARLVRLTLPLLLFVLVTLATAKDKKKPVLPEDILRAQTVRVVIDQDAGEPLDQPRANYMARDNVEKALMEWGRFRVALDGEASDLVISVRTGNGQAVRPTMKGGPMDQRPGVGQSTDSSIRIAGQHGPPISDPNTFPENQRPRISNDVGPSDDSFAVYRGTTADPLDSPAVWRIARKDCLRPAGSQVPAVEEFRKAIAEAEKPKVPKNP
jgi:hypothetical protein